LPYFGVSAWPVKRHDLSSALNALEGFKAWFHQHPDVKLLVNI
jgi:hypothetical protein